MCIRDRVYPWRACGSSGSAPTTTTISCSRWRSKWTLLHPLRVGRPGGQDPVDQADGQKHDRGDHDDADHAFELLGQMLRFVMLNLRVGFGMHDTSSQFCCGV